MTQLLHSFTFHPWFYSNQGEDDIRDICRTHDIRSQKLLVWIRFWGVAAFF